MLLLCPLPAPSQRSSTSPDPDRQPNADRTSKRLYLHAVDMVHDMPFEDRLAAIVSAMREEPDPLVRRRRRFPTGRLGHARDVAILAGMRVRP